MIFFQKMMASDDGIYCRFVRIGAVFRHKKRSEAQSVRRQTFLSIGYTASFCKSTLPSRRFSLPLCKSSNHFCKPTLPSRKFSLPLCKSSNPFCKSTLPLRRFSLPLCKSSNHFCKPTLPLRRFSLPLCKSSNHFCKPTLPLRRFLLGYPTSSRIDKSFLFRDFKGISGFKKEPYSISNFFNLIFARVRALSITFGGNPSLFWIS